MVVVMFLWAQTRRKKAREERKRASKMCAAILPSKTPSSAVNQGEFLPNDTRIVRNGQFTARENFFVEEKMR